MANNKQKRKERIPMSKDKRRELIYIGTIIALIMVIVVMFALKFSDRIFNDTPLENPNQNTNGMYYTPVDPYKIPDRPEEYVQDKVENEIILNDVLYRMNVPFTTQTVTITPEYRDMLVKYTGPASGVENVTYASIAMSLPTFRSTITEDHQIVYSDEEYVIPCVFMLFDCLTDDQAVELSAELKRTIPKDFFEGYTLDDIHISAATGNKVVVCMMMSDAKKTLGISANDLMENFSLYMTTYDGRYQDHQPENIISRTE
jgi:hypothetical protein